MKTMLPTPPLTEAREPLTVDGEPVRFGPRLTLDDLVPHVAVVSAFRLAKQERLVRRLLERWVSGLEPAIAMGKYGEILGLCDADCPLGAKPYIFNPYNPVPRASIGKNPRTAGNQR